MAFGWFGEGQHRPASILTIFIGGNEVLSHVEWGSRIWDKWISEIFCPWINQGNGVWSIEKNLRTSAPRMVIQATNDRENRTYCWSIVFLKRIGSFFFAAYEMVPVSKWQGVNCINPHSSPSLAQKSSNQPPSSQKCQLTYHVSLGYASQVVTDIKSGVCIFCT